MTWSPHKVGGGEYQQSTVCAVCCQYALLTVELARKHASKAREYEEHLNRTLRERQKVFEDTFREQMLNYKRSGKLDCESRGFDFGFLP